MQEEIRKEKYVVLRSFLNRNEQVSISREVLQCHSLHKINDDDDDDTWSPTSSEAALTLALGIDCGGDVRRHLPFSASCIRRAFQACNEEQARFDDETPLTGLALLYGPRASMKAHYDSPTQPGQRSEWLACLSVGAPVRFRCQKELIVLKSGDALVMDAMAVLHGVEEVLPFEAQNDLADQELGLPTGCRLGVLMWRGKNMEKDEEDLVQIDGVDGLFPDSDED